MSNEWIWTFFYKISFNGILPLTNKVELLTGVNDTWLRMQECDTVQCLVLIAFLWPAQLSFAPHQLIAGVKWRQLRGFNLDKRRSSRQICWVSCCRHWKRIRLGVKWRRRRANAHPSTNLNVFFRMSVDRRLIAYAPDERWTLDQWKIDELCAQEFAWWFMIKWQI